jgi:hypothetical protein
VSYKNYLDAIKLIDENIGLIKKASLLPLFPQQDNSLVLAAKTLNIQLPKAYKNFLQIFGKMAFGGEYVYGLDDKTEYQNYRSSNIICNTLDERNINIDPPFPPSFVVIYDLGDGEKYCLDTSKMNTEGECPVVAWYFGRIEKIYEDFGEFFLDTVKAGLKSLEERGEKVNW